MTTAKKVRFLYWAVTLVFLLPMLWSAVQYFTAAPKMMATLDHLGYPAYFAVLLGVAKVLGAAALLYRRPRRLVEWAYAGFTFDTLGATVSHLASGDGVAVALVPLGFFALLVVSYACWRWLDGSPIGARRRR